ncbi:GNAT family N-acetyltransferase [Pedobacter frigidisoli]|uniref:GNAT family N-acetyltransferase n=1 Tax=Pedobacter frigidisoli TaxID=2530455 RepID=A0A4R0P4V0_9SPHI|nr:GNAT family N-acetyltransferase [Pedobacter frigidisoli]TCD10829.1 GNAT family N-acetyltransferase [Pedobacter frigidisoli]
MNSPEFYKPSPTDYPEIITVWEASVRATHHFLTESDIQTYKALILNEYLDQVDLYCIKSEDRILGFIGLNEDNIQMLFIHPDARGKGLGKAFIKFAINEKQIRNVDVNEQNEQAVGFYQHLGFSIIERFSEDAAGKPYPILSMSIYKIDF